MANGMAFEEVEIKGRGEAMAREGVCPSCRKHGFIGFGQDRGGGDGMVGVCLCKGCWTVWRYTLAARWHWRVN